MLTALSICFILYYMTEKEPQKNISNQDDPIWKWWKGEGAWLGKESAAGKESQKKVSSESDPIWEWWKGEGTWLGKEKTTGFKFLTNGNIGGAVGAGLAGYFLSHSVEWGESWKEYGKNNFPLDFFTARGRKTMRAEFKKMRNAFEGIGRN